MPRIRATTLRPLAGLAAAGLAVAILALGAPAANAASETVSVNLASTLGAPQYRASGTLYGMTENAANPPDQYYKNIKWHLERGGGAQLDRPGGWVAGKLTRRWNAMLAQAKRTASLGGTYIIQPGDLWGADGASGIRFPGDNGSWSDFDAFLNTLISDVRTSGITVEWDLWNEPDLNTFWPRAQSQYLAMWAREYRAIRGAFPNAVIVGPSTAFKPSTGSAWWTAFVDYVKSNGVLPNIYSWHDEPGDPVPETRNADALLAAHGISRSRPYQINEYGTLSQQHAGPGAWFIGRLERAGADGLRGNWGSGSALFDNAANLLVHNSAGQYQPRGEWWMYDFYGGMTGSLVATTPSASLEAVASKNTGTVKVLLGNHGVSGTMTVDINRLDTVSGLIKNGQVEVLLQRVPDGNGGAVGGPVTVSDKVVNVSGNTVTVSVPWTNANDGYTITVRP
ncbi:MAG TPA: beta-xylosidase [Pseudonocardiaceae bacterium]|nr:beta-xylosidase [Pseudonocardiaceae bacterium]